MDWLILIGVAWLIWWSCWAKNAIIHAIAASKVRLEDSLAYRLDTLDRRLDAIETRLDRVRGY